MRTATSARMDKGTCVSKLQRIFSILGLFVWTDVNVNLSPTKRVPLRCRCTDFYKYTNNVLLQAVFRLLELLYAMLNIVVP